MDGIHIGFVVRELAGRITGARVDRVLEPEKDELHLVLRGGRETYRLLMSASAANPRMHLTKQAKQNPDEPPMFCMRMRKLLTGGRVQGIRQIGGDRIIEIQLACVDELGEKGALALRCEIMGRHSNIILIDEEGRIVDAIRHVSLDMSRVREVRPGLPYTLPPSQNKLDFAAVSKDALGEALAEASARLDKALTEVLAGIGAASARELSFRLIGEASPHLSAEKRKALAEPLLRLLFALPDEDCPVLLLDSAGEAIDVFPFQQVHLDAASQKAVPDGQSAALDDFFVLRDRRERMSQKSASLVRSLKTHIERSESKLAIHREALSGDERIEEARIQGELLTANLHLLKRAQQAVSVPDYYTGEMRQIALDPRLSPSQNAQRYYRQYQKLREARKHAAEQLKIIEGELEFLTSQLSDVRKCTQAMELDEIRAELVRAGFLRASHSRGKLKRPPQSKPHVCLSTDGIALVIGKNSAQNERLTQGAQPEHTWLHAKDMPGSHVIIQHAGNVPEATLLEAAQLAAWFSQGFRSSRVPVDYTLRKHVRKPSGAAAGYFHYTNQRTLYVTPDEQIVKGLLGREI